MKAPLKNLKVFDCFAGIGGFHVAADQLGHRVVAACEWNASLQKLYAANFNLTPFSDVTQLKPADLPDFDVACAGSPCQSFSVQGLRKGFSDPRGAAMFAFLELCVAKHATYIIIENVASLLEHDRGRSFKSVVDWFSQHGYATNWKILSPHYIGCPHVRHRVFIVARKGSVLPAVPDVPETPRHPPLSSWLDANTTDYATGSARFNDTMRAWSRIFKGGAQQMRHMNLEDHVAGSLDAFPASLRHLKFEDETVPFDECLLRSERQGLMAYKPDVCPTLLHKGNWPALGWHSDYRQITTREAARLMAYPHGNIASLSAPQQKKALGNGVHVWCAKRVIAKLGHDAPSHSMLIYEVD